MALFDIIGQAVLGMQRSELWRCMLKFGLGGVKSTDAFYGSSRRVLYVHPQVLFLIDLHERCIVQGLLRKH